MWMNVTCLVGRATAEPKMRETAGGTTYATLRLAVPRGRGETDFFTVELWGKLANVARTHVRKGAVLSVRCELKQQAWSSGEERRERVALVVRKLGIISSDSLIDMIDEDDAESPDTGDALVA